MALARRQTLLFVLCACVLLAAGYAWGYAKAYTEYYSLSELMDRETLDLEFNSRLLHYADIHQPETVRRKLYQRLSEQVRYVGEIIASSKYRNMAPDAAASLQHAREALSPLRNWGALAANAGAVPPEHPAPVSNPVPQQTPPLAPAQ